jgi:hypothetical protein
MKPKTLISWFEELKKAKYVLTGKVKDWVDQRRK